jgi:hypothetical protein
MGFILSLSTLPSPEGFQDGIHEEVARPPHPLHACQLLNLGQLFPFWVYCLQACKNGSCCMRSRLLFYQRWNSWDINVTKDSSLLLRAIQSPSTGGFLKKTRLYFGFKNTYK